MKEGCCLLECGCDEVWVLGNGRETRVKLVVSTEIIGAEKGRRRINTDHLEI